MNSQHTQQAMLKSSANGHYTTTGYDSQVRRIDLQVSTPQSAKGGGFRLKNQQEGATSNRNNAAQPVNAGLASAQFSQKASMTSLGNVASANAARALLNSRGGGAAAGQPSRKNADTVKEKKRKLSESHNRSKGGKESGAASVICHQTFDARPVGSRGASRGGGPSSNLVGVKNRMSQSGLNSQIAGQTHVSFSKAQEKDKKAKKRTVGNAEYSGPRRADSQLESEGEAGDTNAYAQWAGSTVDGSRPGKPLPKFEKSVFEMNHRGNQQSGSNWRNSRDITKSQNSAVNLNGTQHSQAVDDPNGKKGKRSDKSEERRKRRSTTGELSPQRDVSKPKKDQGDIKIEQNKHQVIDAPAHFTAAHPGVPDQLRFTNPQRIRQTFQEGKNVNITFSSDFCGGNLSRVCRGNQKNEFFLWLSNDAAPYTDHGYKTWFYFSIKGVPQGENITFTFKNANDQSKLYGQGLKPVFRSLPSSQSKWRRIFTKVNYFYNNEDQFTLRFQHMFSNPPTDTVYFAFSYPWSYEDSQAKIDEIEQRFAQAPPEKNLYFHRETIYHSIEGRKMEMMTISSRDGITDEREPIPSDGTDCSGLYPDAQTDAERRPLKFDSNKKVVIFTSRVHPGETPGSHVLNGALDLITDLKSEQGRQLRKNFVFKIIPTLNPDGVSRGYYRLDSLGQNLNRFYVDPDKRLQPTIWAAKKAITQYSAEFKSLETYIDFHAHASKKGVFIFGNALPDQQRQADNITFAKLIAMNCLNFDMNECNFSERIMSIKDKNGMSRDGSSRVALQKATGITHCYTLECNYHSGKRINTLAPKLIKAQGYIEEDTPVSDPNSRIYANTNSPPFSQEIFEDVGYAVAVALLDHINCNPISRIPLSCYKAVENVRDDILNNLAKYSAGQVNVCGVNHFSATNTKVGRQYAKTDAPTLRKDQNGKKSHSVTRDGHSQVLVKPGGGISQITSSGISHSHTSKNGTFGAAKRIVAENKRKTRVRDAGSSNISASGTRQSLAAKEREDSMQAEREQLFHQNAQAVLAARNNMNGYIPSQLQDAQARLLAGSMQEQRQRLSEEQQMLYQQQQYQEQMLLRQLQTKQELVIQQQLAMLQNGSLAWDNLSIKEQQLHIEYYKRQQMIDKQNRLEQQQRAEQYRAENQQSRWSCQDTQQLKLKDDVRQLRQRDLSEQQQYKMSKPMADTQYTTQVKKGNSEQKTPVEGLAHLVMQHQQMQQRDEQVRNSRQEARKQKKNKKHPLLKDSLNNLNGATMPQNQLSSASKSHYEGGSPSKIECSEEKRKMFQIQLLDKPTMSPAAQETDRLISHSHKKSLPMVIMSPAYLQKQRMRSLDQGSLLQSVLTQQHRTPKMSGAVEGLLSRNIAHRDTTPHSPSQHLEISNFDSKKVDEGELLRAASEKGNLQVTQVAPAKRAQRLSARQFRSSTQRRSHIFPNQHQLKLASSKQEAYHHNNDAKFALQLPAIIGCSTDE